MGIKTVQCWNLLALRVEECMDNGGFMRTRNTLEAACQCMANISLG
ncbi:unnamed protein product [Calypogeia fissa]